LPEYEFWKLIFNLTPNIFMKNGNNLRLYPTKGNLHRQLTDTTFSHVSNQIPPANRAIAAILKTLLILLFPAIVSGQACNVDASFTTTGGGCSAVNFSPANNAVGSTHNWFLVGGGWSSTTATPSNIFPLSVNDLLITHEYTPSGGPMVSCTQAVSATCLTYTCAPSISVRIDRVDCEYEFDFTAVSATSVSWNFGDGNTASGDPVTHTYTTPGTYTVTITYVIGGITYYCNFPVYAICDCESDFDYDINFSSCEGLTVSFDSPCDDNVYLHTWKFEDGCPEITGPGGGTIPAWTDPDCITFGTYDDPVHVYNVNTYNSINTSVVVTHEVSPTGNVPVDATIDLGAALPGAGYFLGYFNVQSSLSDKVGLGLAPSALPVNSQDFYIFGQMDIDLNYDIRTSNIFMGQGASMDIVDESLLNLRTTHVEATAECECLWRWISVEDESQLKVNHNSIVEDALFAVYPLDDTHGGAVLKLESSTFRNNFVGLFADVGNFNLNDFSQVTYTMVTSSDLLPSCDLDPEEEQMGEGNIFTGADVFVDEDQGFAGILTIGLSNVDIPTNNSGFADVNLFANMANGIVLRNSTATNINYCRFANILPNTAYLEDGVGINFNTTIGTRELRQEGINNVTGNSANLPTFANCFVGILANTTGAATEIKSFDNTMDGSSNGLSCYILRAAGAGAYVQSEIHDNLMMDYAYGLVLDNHLSNSISEINIHDMVIENTAYGNTGISLQSDGALGNQVYVHDNIIHMNRSENGILLDNWEHDNTPSTPTVHNNVITFDINDNDAGWGIRQNSSDFCIFSCNHITGTYQANDGTGDQGDGIFVLTSDNCEYRFNEINNTRRGMQFSGVSASPNSILLNQFIGNMEHGMLYESASISGDQFDLGNDWSGGVFDDEGAEHFDPNSVNVLGSEYTMPSGAIPTHLSSADPFWFTPSTNDPPTEVDCPDPPEEMMMMAPEEFSEQEYLIASGEFSLEGIYAAGLNRQLQATLYKKIQKADPELLNETLLAFAEEHSGGPVGQLYAVESGIANLVQKLTEPFAEDIAELNTEIEALYAELGEINSQMAEGTDGLLDEKAVLLAELDESLEALNEIYNAIQEDAIEGFAGLLQYNNGITSTCTIDENEIEMNRILLDRKIDPQAAWIEEDWDLVEALAYACPHSDGKKVFLARMWYYNETGILAESECEAEMRNSEEELTGNKVSLKVSPNPVQDLLYIDWVVPEGLSPELLIKDQLGNTVSKLSLPGNRVENYSISCDWLQSGVYFILLQDEHQILISQKIIVVQ
jgi:hypothetical protein